MTIELLNPPVLETIPTPHDLYAEIPLKEKHEAFVLSSRKTIEQILLRKDPRKILIVGPCSIHDEDSTFEFAKKLKNLSNRVSDRFFLVMRTYFEKPRTLMGWKGFLYDPDLDGTYDMVKGLRLSRKMLLTLTEMEVPTAAELLEINTAHYLSDLLSWGCIGARTACSQPHRQLAASLQMPIGFKNTIDGSVMGAIHGMMAANSAHYFLGLQPNGILSRIAAAGNPHVHLVLRGGDEKPNYDATSIAEAVAVCAEKNVLNKIFVDCSHGNSGKRPENQINVFESVVRNPHVVGLMIESHLHKGAQPIKSSLKYGISITDPCLDWETTRDLILRH